MGEALNLRVYHSQPQCYLHTGDIRLQGWRSSTLTTRVWTSQHLQARLSRIFASSSVTKWIIL